MRTEPHSPTTFSLPHAVDFADRLHNEIVPALKAGFIVVADRYLSTACARNTVMRAGPAWTRFPAPAPPTETRVP